MDPTDLWDPSQNMIRRLTPWEVASSEVLKEQGTVAESRKTGSGRSRRGKQPQESQQLTAECNFRAPF